MFRVLLLLSLFALLLWSCGPDSQLSCPTDPAFEVVIKLTARPLPADTVVHVAYGGSGKEEFRLFDRNAAHEVTFCEVADENGSPLDGSAPQATGAAGAAGAAGDSDDSAVAALYCKLYTAGFTTLTITGSGFLPVTSSLSPKGPCTLHKELILDAPDAGS